MKPTPGSGRSPRFSTSIPSAWATAINDLRKQRFLKTNKDDPPSQAEVMREAIELYLAVLKQQNALPADALDDVDGIRSSEVLEDYGLSVSGELSAADALAEIASQEVGTS